MKMTECKILHATCTQNNNNNVLIMAWLGKQSALKIDFKIDH